jgi:hypothetical protein
VAWSSQIENRCLTSLKSRFNPASVSALPSHAAITAIREPVAIGAALLPAHPNCRGTPATSEEGDTLLAKVEKAPLSKKRLNAAVSSTLTALRCQPTPRANVDATLMARPSAPLPTPSRSNCSRPTLTGALVFGRG